MKTWFRKKRVLITLGPTREYLDAVRFVSNASSGTMGLALARRLKSLGARVRLVAGPGVPVRGAFPADHVVSARDMLRAVQKRFARTDIFIACAAVADYGIPNRFKQKIPGKKAVWKIALTPNPDILARVASGKRGRICVGFSLENGTGPRGLERAARKLREKHCDLMVLNSLPSMESRFIDAVLIFKSGDVRKMGRISKEAFAGRLCRAVYGAFGEK